MKAAGGLNKRVALLIQGQQYKTEESRARIGNNGGAQILGRTEGFFDGDPIEQVFNTRKGIHVVNENLGLYDLL